MISCTRPMLRLTYFIFSSLQVPKWSKASHASLGAKLSQLHNLKRCPTARYALLCLYRSVVRRQKPLYTEINTRVSKHRAPLYWVFRLFEFGAGILIHILDLSYDITDPYLPARLFASVKHCDFAFTWVICWEQGSVYTWLKSTIPSK